MNDIRHIISRFCVMHNLEYFAPRAVLFDMDGILYNSMPLHAKAWKGVADAAGIEAEEDEFYAYEGRTGASTIDLLIRRQFGRPATDEECKRLYQIKAELFAGMGTVDVMPGAQAAVATVVAAGATPVLVTGSGQGSLLQRLDADYEGAFTPQRRVTAYDVVHGKPHPEPFLRGADKAGVPACMCIGVDNAPLGVQSAAAAGTFVVGVRTGPLPKGALLSAGALIELDSMTELTDFLNNYAFLSVDI